MQKHLCHCNVKICCVYCFKNIFLAKLCLDGFWISLRRETPNFMWTQVHFIQIISIWKINIFQVWLGKLWARSKRLYIDQCVCLLAICIHIFVWGDFGWNTDKVTQSSIRIIYVYLIHNSSKNIQLKCIKVKSPVKLQAVSHLCIMTVTTCIYFHIYVHTKKSVAWMSLMFLRD